MKKIEIEWEMAQSSFVNLHERPVHRVRWDGQSVRRLWQPSMCSTGILTCLTSSLRPHDGACALSAAS